VLVLLEMEGVLENRSSSTLLIFLLKIKTISLVKFEVIDLEQTRNKRSLSFVK
jgi:hypothetical protein